MGCLFPSVLDPIVTSLSWGPLSVTGLNRIAALSRRLRCILTVLFEAGNRPGRRTRGHRSNRRPQPIFRAYPKLLGIFSTSGWPTSRPDASEGGRSFAFYPKVRSHRDRPRGQVFTVGGKLSGAVAGSTAAKEEDEMAGQLPLGVMGFGIEKG